MKKKRGKNILLVFSICTILLVGIFITAQSDAIKEIRNRIDASISTKADAYISNFAEKKGIEIEKINRVEKVDLQNPPEEISIIGSVKNSNLAVYQIDFDDSGESKKVFVISYSSEGLKAGLPQKNVTTSGEIPKTPPQRIPTIFEFKSDEMTQSEFLESIAGATGSIKSGYSMVADGNILVMRTNLEIYEESEGKIITITLYKNGNPTSIFNSFVVDPSDLIITSGARSYFTYTLESKGNVSFKKGDIISVYVTLSDGMNVKSITTSVNV